MSEVTEKDVHARLVQVEEELQQHETIVVMLRKERENLVIALQVLQGLHGRPSYASNAVIEVTSEKDGRARSTKPKGSPPLAVMVMAVVREAKSNGVHGLSPKTILEGVRGKYRWPQASANSISPTAWRLAEQGQLTRDGDLYALSEAENETNSSEEE